MRVKSGFESKERESQFNTAGGIEFQVSSFRRRQRWANPNSDLLMLHFFDLI